MIELLRKVQFSYNIRPAKLPTRAQAGDLFEGVQAVIAGYGRTSDSKFHSQSMNLLLLNIIFTLNLSHSDFTTTKIYQGSCNKQFRM